MQLSKGGTFSGQATLALSQSQKISSQATVKWAPSVCLHLSLPASPIFHPHLQVPGVIPSCTFESLTQTMLFLPKM